jgi:hypothetical protein
MIRLVESLDLLGSFGLVGYFLCIGVRETPMLSIVLFFPSVHSAGFTKSSFVNWVPV